MISSFIAFVDSAANEKMNIRSENDLSAEISVFVTGKLGFPLCAAGCEMIYYML